MAVKENGAFLDTEIAQDTKTVRDTGRLNEPNWDPDSRRYSVFIRIYGGIRFSSGFKKEFGFHMDSRRYSVFIWIQGGIRCSSGNPKNY